MDSPIILITGATRGIGFAAAEILVARGACVVISSRDEARARDAARKIGCRWISMDVTNDATVKAAAAAFPFPSLDVLVNNAAILLDHYSALTELSPATLLQTLDANVAGPLRVSQAFLPLLDRSARPKIINVSSGAGQLDGEPQPWAPAYSVSKTALNMLTQQLSAALPRVEVNSMCPGWCRTEMGGMEAPLSAADGADTLVWLALEAPHGTRGKFFKRRTPIPW